MLLLFLSQGPVGLVLRTWTRQEALFAAGARASITSLWKVPDKATQLLMSDFYRRMWMEGKPKRQALWEAQMAIRNKKDAEGRPICSIRDWAAWVLVGDD